jgi:mannose-6-phosphate isomerase-like protein (cupin superfamily)
LRREWGYRIPLEAARNQNCWLLGVGRARFLSAHLILAYVNYRTVEEANAGLGTRYSPHLHEKSWEYYVVWQGARTLWVDGELVTVKAGEILEVPPNACHTLYGSQTPSEGFVFRIPILESSDKVECSI